MPAKVKTVEQFFRKIVDFQSITEEQENRALQARKDVEELLKNKLPGDYEILYAGSIEKKTAIQDDMDLHLILNWPASTKTLLPELHEKVRQVVRKKWRKTQIKSLGMELPFKGGLAVSIIPGIKVREGKEANLALYYDVARALNIETNFSTQVIQVKTSKRADIIRLIKIWKQRKDVPLKSFILEQLVILGSRGTNRNQFEPQLLKVLNYIHDNILIKNVNDFANQNNNVSDLISKEEKNLVKQITLKTLEVKTWNKVFKK